MYPRENPHIYVEKRQTLFRKAFFFGKTPMQPLITQCYKNSAIFILHQFNQQHLAID